MTLKQKILTAFTGLSMMLVPASALASTYSGTTVSPQADNVTYPVTASSGDSLNFSGAGQPGSTLTVTFKNNVYGTITIKPTTTLPASATGAPSGTVNTYFDVTLSGFTNNDIGSSTWSFSTPKSFLNNLGLSTSNLFLEHFNGTTWDRLSTKSVSSDATNNNFSANVISFSPFAVVAVPGLTNTGTSYAVLAAGGVAAVALIVGAYLLTRKSSKHTA